MADYNRVVIAGVGLLGGSIGLALRERGLASEVVGWGRDTSKLQLAIEQGVIDRADGDLGKLCRDADVIIVCTPVQIVPEFVRDCAAMAPSTAVITDVGSTKAQIAQALSSVPNFCGSHPLAGGEKSGAQFADATLFCDRTCVVTPSPATAPSLAKEIGDFWKRLGAQVVHMTPAEHDAALALTSHLPHIVAAILAGNTPEELLPLAATGWSDTTRVAAGNVDLWTQIIQENRLPILEALKSYRSSLETWIDAVDQDDLGMLEKLLTKGKMIRDALGN